MSDKTEVPMTLLQRLNAVMRDVSYVQKDKQIEVGKGYMVVTHDKVTAAVRPALVEHGVYYYPHKLEHQQNGNRTEMSITVRFINIDNAEDFIDVPCLGYGIDQGDKGPGKAMSYAVKYALLKALGLETGEDADNEVTEHKPDPAGVKAERGPKGGRAKTESDAKTLVLKVGKDAYSYPFDGWDNIRAFITDLHVSLEGNPDVWDINQNDIRRVKEKLTMAGHTKLLDQLQEAELFVEQQFLQAG